MMRTREIAAAVVKERFGIAFSPKWISQILTEMGFTPQRPRYRSDRADPDMVEQWRTATFPQIAAAAREAGPEIFFGDESAVQLGFHAGTTWDRKGQPRFRLRSGVFDAVVFVDFWKRLPATADRQVFLIVDDAGVHQAEVVKAFEESTEGRLRLFYLPPYSPQLHSDELVWSTVKNGRIESRSVATAV